MGVHDEDVVGSRMEDKGRKNLLDGGERKGKETKGEMLDSNKKEERREEKKVNIYGEKEGRAKRGWVVCQRAKKCRRDETMGDQVNKKLFKSSDSRLVLSQKLKRI